MICIQFTRDTIFQAQAYNPKCLKILLWFTFSQNLNFTRQDTFSPIFSFYLHYNILITCIHLRGKERTLLHWTTFPTPLAAGPGQGWNPRAEMQSLWHCWRNPKSWAVTAASLGGKLQLAARKPAEWHTVAHWHRNTKLAQHLTCPPTHVLPTIILLTLSFEEVIRQCHIS